MTVNQSQGLDVLRAHLAGQVLTPAQIEAFLQLLIALLPLFTAASSPSTPTS
jgi:hypothetical protein